jgi:hypothetical protein
LDRVVIAMLGASLSWLAIAVAWPDAPWLAVVAAMTAGVGVAQLLASRRARREDSARLN